MAFISSFEHRTDRIARYRREHKCGWFAAYTAEKGRILQLETYASDGTTDQIFQFDRRAAAELAKIIAEVFVADRS